MVLIYDFYCVCFCTEFIRNKCIECIYVLTAFRLFGFLYFFFQWLFCSRGFQSESESINTNRQKNIHWFEFSVVVELIRTTIVEIPIKIRSFIRGNGSSEFFENRKVSQNISIEICCYSNTTMNEGEKNRTRGNLNW